MGKKDSTWGEYNSSEGIRDGVKGHLVRTSGNYKEGKKIGIWTTPKKDRTEHYDFDKKEKINYDSVMKVKYPKSASELGIQGTVIV